MISAQPMERHKGRGAFTIAEMLLAIVLIALLAGAAGGIYIGTYKKSLVEKSAKDFFLAAKYARILAIERQNRCSLKLDEINNKFMLVFGEADENENSEQVIVQDLYFKPTEFAGEVKFENVRIESVDSQQDFGAEPVSEIIFSPDGSAQAAIIQIGDGKNHLTVRISAVTGKAKIYAGTSENVKSDTVDLDLL